MSDNSSDGGCGIIILIIIVYLLFSATGKDIEEATNSEEISQMYVENYPWPHSEEDAIQRCLYAIQTRNWENYVDCFEPSSVMIKSTPGNPGTFTNVGVSVLQTDGQVSIVRIQGEWTSSRVVNGEGNTYYFSEIITVVKAKKNLLGNLKINIDFAMEGWFVAYTEIKKLPFNFNSKFIPTPTPTITQTPMPSPPDILVTPSIPVPTSTP